MTKLELELISQDFKKQIKTNDEINSIHLLQYHLKKHPFSISDYENFLDEKYRSYINGKELRDYDYACDTKVYLKSLSFKKIPRIFLQTLIKHKKNLMDELSLTNNEYDELMILSLGTYKS